MDRYNVIGTMSGTSLDGLDIAYCSIEISDTQEWSFKIISASTIEYDSILKERLSSSTKLNGLDLMKLHNDFGNFIGFSVNDFINKKEIDKNVIDCISSHGHTVFHQPKINLTTQIGNGANISVLTKLPVICDFRSTDIALYGQGAPLVPIGDQLLFSEYDYCINLGGIANISFLKNTNRVAFDICPVNIVLNRLANDLGQTYDKGGYIAKTGAINQILLVGLNQIQYYSKHYPKSLGIEQIEKDVFPIIDSSNISTKDKLRTYIEHISIQIANNIKLEDAKVLLTGGGTFNEFLVERIKSNTNNNIIIPNKEIIDFKEALIFAFLGVLKLRNETNCLQSVTGSTQNNIGGCIYQSF